MSIYNYITDYNFFKYKFNKHGQFHKKTIIPTGQKLELLHSIYTTIHMYINFIEFKTPYVYVIREVD